MIRRLRSLAILVTLTAMLGACHSQQKAGHGTVSGQILPGSVSDAMLPYDAVKSKAPLAPREEAEHAGNEPDDTAADTADAGVAADAPTPDAGASLGTVAPAPVD